MGLLINDSLIWLSVPRCASVSIENAFLNSNLKIRRLKADTDFEGVHMHFSKSVLFGEFGIHNTICIKRDWFLRWISGLYQFFDLLSTRKLYTPIIHWEDIDNNFIYKTFDTDFANLLYSNNEENWDIIFLRLIKETSLKDKIYDMNGNIIPNSVGSLAAFKSQNFYKQNEPTDYEFDISELDKFSDFIYDKFGERLNIMRLNERKPIPNKIIIDDKLKQWIWDKFEAPFQKRNSLI
jgi:hypothetical protein